MSVVMIEEIERRTALCKSALVLEMIPGKTTVAEANYYWKLAEKPVAKIA